MKFATIPITVILLLALVLSPLGPLADHHSAERQPHHHHLGITHYDHSHSYDHPHADTPAGDLDATGQPVALINFESGPAANTVVIIYDPAAESLRSSEQKSLFTFPSAPSSLSTQHYMAPPDKPPKHLL